MSENALHPRYRVTPGPTGTGYGVFDTTIQEWCARTRDGARLATDMSFEDAQTAAVLLETTQDETEGAQPTLPTNDRLD